MSRRMGAKPAAKAPPLRDTKTGQWLTGCLAKATSVEEVDDIMQTVPRTKNPTSLAEFGYHFDDRGCLVQISNGKPFAWLGQKHYDKLGDCLINDIYKLLETQFGLQRLAVPLGAARHEPSCPIFKSPNFDTAEVAVVLCQGSGAVRPGMWARALCINNSLEYGTIFSYLKAIQERGWGVVVLNPNENTVPANPPLAEPTNPSAKGASETVEEYWLNTPDMEWKLFCRERKMLDRDIEASACPEEHMLYVWDNIVAQAKAPIVPIIAHSYGGRCTSYLVRSRMEHGVAARVPAVVFTDAINDLDIRKDKKSVVDFMQSRVVNWVASHNPLDTKERSRNKCTEVSAGHAEHEWTSASCQSSAFAFLDKFVAKAAIQVADSAAPKKDAAETDPK